MIILALESSCDETAAAIVKDGRQVLSNVVSSQIKIHEKFGGVVPEVAAREHLNSVNMVIEEELKLETIIKEHKNQTNEGGKTLYTDISEIQAPSGVTIDSEGNIFTASFAENAIYKISIYGKKSVFTNSSLIKGPVGVATDTENNIYIANYNANNILKVTPNGAVSIFSEIQKPYCILFDKQHNRLYVTEQHTNKVVKIDL